MNYPHPSPFIWTETFEAFWRHILNKFFYIYRRRYFYFFLAPASKLFRVTSLNWLHWHFIFHMVCNKESKQHRQIYSVFRYFSAIPVFRGVPVFRDVAGCSGVFGCSGVPVFLVLVHAVTRGLVQFTPKPSTVKRRGRMRSFSFLFFFSVVSFAAARTGVTQRSPSLRGCFKPTYIPFPEIN